MRASVLHVLFFAVSCAARRGTRGKSKAGPAHSDPAVPPPAAASPPPEVEEGGSSCVVCLEHPRTVVLLPCRHLSMCAVCAADVSMCPMCRSAVGESIDTSLPSLCVPVI